MSWDIIASFHVTKQQFQNLDLKVNELYTIIPHLLLYKPKQHFESRGERNNKTLQTECNTRSGWPPRDQVDKSWDILKVEVKNMVSNYEEGYLALNRRVRRNILKPVQNIRLSIFNFSRLLLNHNITDIFKNKTKN